MLNINSLSINASSGVDGKDIVYFGASFSGSDNQNYTITKNVVDGVSYAEHKEACDAEFEEFENKAVEYAKAMKSV